MQVCFTHKEKTVQVDILQLLGVCTKVLIMHIISVYLILVQQTVRVHLTNTPHEQKSAVHPAELTGAFQNACRAHGHSLPGRCRPARRQSPGSAPWRKGARTAPTGCFSHPRLRIARTSVEAKGRTVRPQGCHPPGPEASASPSSARSRLTRRRRCAAAAGS